jgi:hypothetical protein
MKMKTRPPPIIIATTHLKVGGELLLTHVEVDVGEPILQYSTLIFSEFLQSMLFWLASTKAGHYAMNIGSELAHVTSSLGASSCIDCDRFHDIDIIQSMSLK